MTTDYELAINELKTLLKLKKITVLELAEKFGKTTQTMGSYFNGKHIMPLDIYLKVLDLLGYTVSISKNEEDR